MPSTEENALRILEFLASCRGDLIRIERVQEGIGLSDTEFREAEDFLFNSDYMRGTATTRTITQKGTRYLKECREARSAPVEELDPVARAVWDQRLDDLTHNISADLQLLREYEDALRYEDDPRRRARYRQQIRGLLESATSYQQSYDELRAQIGGELPDAMCQAAAQLDQIHAKLDALLAGQMGIREDVKDLGERLLSRYDAGEQTIIGVVIDHLDQAQATIVQSVLDAVEADQVPASEMQEVLDAVRELLAALQANGVTVHADQPKVAEAIASPALDIRHRLKIALPIVPLLVGYEGELAVDLKATWNWLKDWLSRRTERT